MNAGSCTTRGRSLAHTVGTSARSQLLRYQHAGQNSGVLGLRAPRSIPLIVWRRSTIEVALFGENSF